MVTDNFSWGGTIDQFPSSLWDDFDGTIEDIIYETGEFNTQIHVVIRPAEYEYEARELNYDPNQEEGLPQGWYSMGQAQPILSDDGYDIEGFEGGKKPGQGCRAVKLMMGTKPGTGLRDFARKDGKSLELSSLDLRPFIGSTVHWKVVNETTRNPQTQEEKTRGILYPSGVPTGVASGGTQESTRVANVSEVSNVEITDETLAEAAELLNSMLESRDSQSIKRTMLKVLSKNNKFKDNPAMPMLLNNDVIDRLIADGFVDGDKAEVRMV